MITIRKITPSLAAVMRRGWQSNVAFFLLARLAALLFTAGLWLIQPAKAAARQVRGRAARRLALSMKCCPLGWCMLGTG
jgi:hypothetical protein